MTKVEREFESKIGKAVDASPYGSDFTVLVENLKKIKEAENKEELMQNYVDNDSVSVLFSKKL